MSVGNWDLREFADGPQSDRLGGASWRFSAFLVLLIAMMGGALAWANWATIEQVARADGQVVPSGRAQTVESLEGGIIREIHVREGDSVTRGDILVRIDDTGSAANLGELRAQQEALLARAHRLEAAANGASGLDFQGTGIDPQGALALQETALFDSRNASYFGQRAVLDAQVVQRAQEIKELDMGVERMGEMLALLDEEIQLREDSGVVSRAQLLPIERERIARRQERDGLVSQRGQAQSALAEAEARRAELDLQRRAEISTERSDTLNQLSVIDQSLKRADDIVMRANLRAPVDGIVSALNVNTIGSVIAPGEEILRVVPLDERLQVDARARPEDVAFLRPDLPARVKLTSFDFTIYGALDGRVTRIGADAEKDEATGQVYFPIIVETDSNTLTRNGDTFEIRPGMVASVDILTGDQTVLDYILKPFRKARAEAMRER